MPRLLVAALLLAAPARARFIDDAPRPAPTLPRPASLPDRLPRPELERLLQAFVDRLHGRAFRHLGDERDFDHGHFLFGSDPERPVAILYHTQELAYYYAEASPFGYLDPEARNWLQWVNDATRIENARDYLRRDYPQTRLWEWFRRQELPALERHRTVLDKMLDPRRFGADTISSRQWVFSRRECPPSGAPDLSVTLPTRQRVCLELSAY